jgi:hypothetical protein
MLRNSEDSINWWLGKQRTEKRNNTQKLDISRVKLSTCQCKLNFATSNFWTWRSCFFSCRGFFCELVCCCQDRYQKYFATVGPRPCLRTQRATAALTWEKLYICPFKCTPFVHNTFSRVPSSPNFFTGMCHCNSMARKNQQLIHTRFWESSQDSQHKWRMCKLDQNL